ncbi:MAG TPA: alpha-amylase family glycosyl hydrolase [Bacteroidota bacterium]|nr:alpha-amylase family glycosyl hydrolase [Bacteroidota bacterium]
MVKLFPLLLLALMVVSASGQEAAFRLPLDGEWLFKVDSMKAGIAGLWYLDSLDRSGWDRVQTPKYWEDYPGMAGYDGWGWFFRTFVLERTGGPISLYFAGVDDDAEVWVNGVAVGGHSGYTDPFALDVTSALRPGVNSVAVLVKDFGGGGGIYKPVTLIPTRSLDELLKGPYFGTPALKSADWVRDAVIYSVYLRSFSPEGNFEGLEKRLPELKDLGVTVLWLLPVNPVGEKNRKGTLGSPYSVRDYYGINPEFGTLQDFRRLLASAKREGMRLIIDLVANHTSWDSRLITEHPDWFRKDAQGNIVSPNSNWTDVAALDYTKPELRRYMIDMMRWWVKDVGIDGFRCDVAELVPNDFWEEARSQLNRIKPVMMIAEGSLPQEHVRAFDLTYSWNVYDALDPLLQGKRPVTLLDQILKNERLQFPTGSIRMRFTTNHDKNAWDAPAVLKFGADGLRLATVLINTLPGAPMIYTGEEVANDRKLSLFEKVSVDWSRPRDMGNLWKFLIALRRSHMALSRGDMLRVASAPEGDIFTFFRAAGTDKILVVLNFSAEPRTASLAVPMDRIFPRQGFVKMKDVSTGKTVVLQPGAALEMPLEPRGYRIFTYDLPPKK